MEAKLSVRESTEVKTSFFLSQPQLFINKKLFKVLGNNDIWVPKKFRLIFDSIQSRIIILDNKRHTRNPIWRFGFTQAYLFLSLLAMIILITVKASYSKTTVPAVVKLNELEVMQAKKRGVLKTYFLSTHNLSTTMMALKHLPATISSKPKTKTMIMGSPIKKIRSFSWWLWRVNLKLQEYILLYNN